MDYQHKFRAKQVETFELLQEPEANHDKLREQKEECEKKLDSDLSLDSGEIVADNVTPRVLVGCQTNSLEKALEVSYKLKVLSRSTRGQQRENELLSLSSSVEDFAIHLLHPIKSSAGFSAFEKGVDIVVDKALSWHRKKFLSHRVIQNLLLKEWKGSFYDLGWFLTLVVNVLVVLDILVYPFVFLPLFLCYYGQVNEKTLFENYILTPQLVFLRETMSYLILVFLHFVVCIQPMKLEFSVIEWLIMVFFIGRIFNELYQMAVERDKSQYFSNLWNLLDILTVFTYLALFIMRMTMWRLRSPLNSRFVAAGGYLYGINTMFLSLRVSGQIIEYNKSIGLIQIALFKIIGAVMVIVGQFFAAMVMYSFAITKVYMTEITYSSNRNATVHGLCTTEKEGLSCWWRFFRHLAWSLLDAGGPEVMTSSDEISDGIAKFIYMLFLLNAVILVMNILTAVLTNVYQKVEDNAFYEWSYRKARTIRTYHLYHPVPMPFNIISLPLFLAFKRLCFCEDWGQYNKSREHAESFLFLIRRLESSYFAKYGYSFPLSDGDKLDQVLNETEGNRHLSGHIAESLFKQPDIKHSTKQYWESFGIHIDGQQLQLCSGSHQNTDQVRHAARHLSPLSTEKPGFEVLIKESGQKRYIAIGLVEINYSLTKFPGWTGNSVGFHVDDGKIFDVSEKDGKRRGKETGFMAFRGDVIGCTIMYAEKTQDKLPVSFTLNGKPIGQGNLNLTTTIRNFYPFIGIGDPEIELLFKMPTTSNQDSDRIQELSDKVSKLQLEVANLTFGIKRLLEGGHFQLAIPNQSAKPLSITSPVFIETTQEANIANQASDLKRLLGITKIMTVFDEPPQIPGIILIKRGVIKQKPCWIACRESKIIVPPMGVNQEETMAGNLSRFLRYEAALKQAKSPTNERQLLKGVDFKVKKVENMEPYGTNPTIKRKRVHDGLQKGITITEEDDGRQYLKAHLVDDATGKLIDKSGDSFVFQVTNNNQQEVYISVLIFQLDGSISFLYPKNSSSKTLKSGCSVEDIKTEYIPTGSLRIMAQPGLSHDEPNMGIDTLVLYASSKEVDLRPLVQSPMKTDPDLIEGVFDEEKTIGDFQEFLKALQQFNVTTSDDFQWMIETKKLVVVKNPTGKSPA